MGSSSATGKMHTPQLLLLPLLVVAFSSLDSHLAADDHGAQSIITVVGSVVSQATNAPFSGALVGIGCQDGDGQIVFLRQAVTDRCGGFRVHLNPSADTRRLASVKSCSVQLLQPRQPKSSNAAAPCDTAAATGSGDVVSIGAFAVRPDSVSSQNKGLFFPPNPLTPGPPKIGGVPIPPLTPGPPSILPPLIPGVPLPPLIPGGPPGSLLPPLPPLIPGVPSPPSSILPPVPLLPPIPKIPGIPQIPPIPLIPGGPPGSLLPPIPLIPGGPPGSVLPPSILPPIPKIPGVPLLPPIPLIPGGPPAA